MGNSVIWVSGALILFAICLWVLQIGLLGSFIMISFADLLWRCKLAGNITVAELKRLHGRKRVGITDVTKITGRYWINALTPRNVILDVYTANYCLVITVDEREILNLIRLGLSDWVIGTSFFRPNMNRFIIKPCNEGTPRHIQYDVIGKYAFSPDTILFSILFFVLGSSSAYSFGLINIWLLVGLLFIPYLFFIPSFIAKIQITLDEKGVIIKDADEVRFLSFDEITLVDKGLYRIKITTKSGEVLYFPKACYMLVELINELGKKRMY